MLISCRVGGCLWRAQADVAALTCRPPASSRGAGSSAQDGSRQSSWMGSSQPCHKASPQHPSAQRPHGAGADASAAPVGCCTHTLIRRPPTHPPLPTSGVRVTMASTACTVSCSSSQMACSGGGSQQEAGAALGKNVQKIGFFPGLFSALQAVQLGPGPLPRSTTCGPAHTMLAAMHCGSTPARPPAHQPASPHPCPPCTPCAAG